MSDESFSARCRRVLEKGPAGEDDYEAACYLIGQGLADGVCGPPSKGRDTYGKITKVFWRCPTAAGRLWLEQQSALGEMVNDRHQVTQDEGVNGDDSHLQRGKNDRSPGKPSSNLVNTAWAVAGGVVLLLIGYLIKTHLGIAL